MVKNLTKYRISLPLGKGTYVAASNPEDAVKACLPEGSSFKVHSTGPRWVMYDTETELPAGWPTPKEGITRGGGYRLDVEEHGTMLVVIDD